MSMKYFISGTDTAIGKTLVGVALLHAARSAGHSAIGAKPVAAGCDLIDGIWQNEDAAALRSASSLELSYEQVNPIALKAFMAPHIAAEREGVKINAVDLCRKINALPDAEITFIEGAGGWLVPLNDKETMADIATGLQVGVILVVGLRLGCINHALLSAAAIKQSGLKIAGWVANSIEPAMDVKDGNIAAIEKRLQAPLLGTIPYLNPADPEAAAALLDIEPLL